MTDFHHAKYRFSFCFTNYGKPFYCTLIQKNTRFSFFSKMDVVFRTELGLVDKCQVQPFCALRKLEGSPQQQQQQQFISTTVYN